MINCPIFILMFDIFNFKVDGVNFIKAINLKTQSFIKTIFIKGKP